MIQTIPPPHHISSTDFIHMKLSQNRQNVQPQQPLIQHSRRIAHPRPFQPAGREPHQRDHLRLHRLNHHPRLRRSPKDRIFPIQPFYIQPRPRRLPSGERRRRVMPFPVPTHVRSLIPSRRQHSNRTETLSLAHHSPFHMTRRAIFVQYSVYDTVYFTSHFERW